MLDFIVLHNVNLAATLDLYTNCNTELAYNLLNQVSLILTHQRYLEYIMIIDSHLVDLSFKHFCESMHIGQDLLVTEVRE